MRSISLLFSILLIAGCAEKKAAPDETPAAAMNPYAAYAGDWIMEAYAPDGTEPLVVSLLKATDTASGWTMKFTHLDEALPSRVSMRGDSVVVKFGPYPSALTEGATVREVTSVMHVHGDAMSGTFGATYEGDVAPIRGRMEGEKVK